MLVLSRRAGESVVIGDDVVVTVLDVRGDVVRVGIKAPRAIQVHREEVYRELQRANREAALPGHLDDEALGALLGPDRPDRPGGPPVTRSPLTRPSVLQPPPPEGAARSGPGPGPAPGASPPPSPGP
jgi:carbon storage regulator